MFIRQKKNRSGSVSIQIISKNNGRNKILKTIGRSSSEEGLRMLLHQARHEVSKIQSQSSLFFSEEDARIEGFLRLLDNSTIQVIGPELVFGKIYDAIGFGAIKEDLFRHLVIARIAFPLSKLKTIDYLYRFQAISLNASSVYRFLDKLNKDLKQQVQQIAFNHTLKVLKGNISVVFYDMTTLYFEAEDEDDLRKAGFSKDGKHSNPQIYLGLMVTLGGYAIGYEMFEGNIFEGHTLIPFIEKIAKRFNLSKSPIVVADAGLLSTSNMLALEQQNYKYIIGARLKTEAHHIQEKIMVANLGEGQSIIIPKQQHKLLVTYSDKRAHKDAHNRKRGLMRLEKQLKKGRLTKAHINNKGYNKYLRMKGEVSIEIDYHKYQEDAKWDGLKGYVTNTSLKAEQIIENYSQLWQIENAFRMSKTDLRIRPIYHRMANRIEAHICVSFTAYAIYKEMEQMLKKEKIELSVRKAAEQTQTMYQLTVTLPESKRKESIVLQMTETQRVLIKLIAKYF
jgi:hypothetical protein